jgi:two-component system, NtrC family, nitrogen regulation sensor histidine kinase GlnL
MEVFSDSRRSNARPVNIHQVLEHVRRIAQNGFAGTSASSRTYDPSLPPVWGNRDQLVQVFLNLVKNAAEAVDRAGRDRARHRLSTRRAHRGAGQRDAREPAAGGQRPRQRPRASPRICAPHLFDPSSPPSAAGRPRPCFVAKIIGDHGGLIECDSQPRRTVFRVLLPIFVESENGDDARS